MPLRNQADIGADIQASQAAPYRAEDTTYRELLNAGDVGLLGNEKRRDALARYTGSTDSGMAAAQRSCGTC
jgi:hypothetical protein